MADHDDDLAEAIRDLTRTIDDLAEELEPRRRRPPLRPPTPREVLAFTDEVAIPALLTALRSSVRTLEAFQRGLEVVRTEREVRDRASETAVRGGDRAKELRRTTLSQLDSVLAELQRAASEGTLPADEQARDLLGEARTLRDEVDERLREATSDADSRASDSSGPVRIDVQDGTPDEPTVDPGEDEPDSSIDVDAELETLKDQYGTDEDGDSDGTDADADDADDADDSSDSDDEDE